MDALEGYRCAYLDTKGDLRAAVRCYERHGFSACERYSDNAAGEHFHATEGSFADQSALAADAPAARFGRCSSKPAASRPGAARRSKPGDVSK